MDESFLYYLVNVEDIRFDEDVINLIKAPCGAGKTTLAIEKLIPELSSNKRSLYLIDTIAGRDQLSTNKHCQVYDPKWRFHLSDDNLYWYANDKVNVMTYAMFGELCIHSPNWYYELDLIICDEIDSFIEMIEWEIVSKDKNRGKVLQCAWGNLLNGVTEGNIGALIAMTATPNRFYKFLDAKWDDIEQKYTSPLVYEVPIHGTPKCYKAETTETYHNLKMLCERLPLDQKGIIYIQRIEGMLQHMEILKSRGLNVVGLWSIHNTDHEMSKQQHEVRNYIIEHGAIPDDIDVLFINKSYETSINIKSHVDYMVVHCSDDDVVTQAAGRFRGNLKTLYRHDAMMRDEFTLPEDMLNKRLYKEDLDEYIARNNIRNNYGRLMGHSAFEEYAISCGYKCDKGKVKGGKRYTTFYAA